MAMTGVEVCLVPEVAVCLISVGKLYDPNVVAFIEEPVVEVFVAAKVA